MKTSKKIHNKPEDEFELKSYLLALKTKYDDIGSYEDQSILLRVEFGINIEPREIWKMSEPTIEEEQLDTQLILKNQNIIL